MCSHLSCGSVLSLEPSLSPPSATFGIYHLVTMLQKWFDSILRIKNIKGNQIKFSLL